MIRYTTILISFLTAFNLFSQALPFSNPANRGCAAFGTDTASVRKYLDYCKSNGLDVYFPTGTYQVPENWTYTWGSTPLRIRGDGADKSIITCNAFPLKYTERIDLSQPKLIGDGYYIADVVPISLHSDWSALTGIAVGDYFKIVSGTPSTTTRATAVTNGYVAEIDMRESSSDPAQDGLYVVALVDYNWGGGVAHDTVNWLPGIRFTVGSVLKRTGGVWSKYNPGNGITFTGDFSCENVGFRNMPSFIFSPIGTSANKKFSLKNCNFSHITRVNGLQTSGGDSGALLAGWTYKPGGGADNAFAGFAWDSYRIEGCKFSNILTSINWFTAFAKNWIIKGNIIQDCFTLITAFEHQLNEVDYPVSNIIEGNTFQNVRNYSGGYAIDRTLIKTKQNAIVTNNYFQQCNGIHVYIQGRGNTVSGNRFNVFNEVFSINNANTLLIKGGAFSNPDMVSSNTFTGGGSTVFVAFQKNAPLKLTGNYFYHLIPPTTRTIEAGTAYIDKSLAYTVNDTANFHTLAGVNNYDPAIVASNKVYYDYNQARWKVLSYSGLFSCVMFSPTENCAEGIEMKGNTGNAEYYFYSNTPTYTLDNLWMEDVITANTITTGAEDITNIFLNITANGAPSLNASPGSIYRRNDGGTSTSIYIKETAKSNTTWQAK